MAGSICLVINIRHGREFIAIHNVQFAARALNEIVGRFNSKQSPREILQRLLGLHKSRNGFHFVVFQVLDDAVHDWRFAQA